MRIWGIPLQFMCTKHISGMHNEIHKHLPSLYRGVSVHGRFNPIVQIELHSLQYWHDQCAEHLKHHSPLTVNSELLKLNYPEYYNRRINLTYNIRDLLNRCDNCCDLLIREYGWQL